jgi:hypothetical protein
MLSIYGVTHSNKFMNDKKFYQVVSEHVNKQIYEQIRYEEAASEKISLGMSYIQLLIQIRRSSRI